MRLISNAYYIPAGLAAITLTGLLDALLTDSALARIFAWVLLAVPAGTTAAVMWRACARRHV